MSAESPALDSAVTPVEPGRSPLADLRDRLAPALILSVLAGGFVLIGGANLDLGELDARLGLAAGEGSGPFGRVYGGWEPSIWPGRLLPCVAWAWGEGATPSSASVRWPSAIAAVLAGVILARRARLVLGRRAGILAGLCWFGSVGLIDRSGGAGLDMLTGLWTIAALDRIVGRGTDRVAGLWAALALLTGGWPPLALIVLATVVLGRREAGLSGGLLGPPALAFAVWSAWALADAPTEAWGAALALPFTQGPSWRLALGVAALGLPWSPFALLALARSAREGETPGGSALVVGWLQILGVCLLAGTLIPGFAEAARVPALAGLALASAAGCARVWAGTVPPTVRRAFLTLACLGVFCWLLIAVVGGISFASRFPFYRGILLAVLILSVLNALLAVASVERRQPSWGLAAVAVVAVCLKLAHWGFFVPEWNYRFSKGPWGRAVGQWVLPRWPVYTTHAWPHDFGFAIGRPVRQLRHPVHLEYQPGRLTKFVLLTESELENWPEQAPKLVKVASFQDEEGGTRILARTEGPFSWRIARLSGEE